MQKRYTPIENATWEHLITKRKPYLANQACEMYLQGLENLQLPTSYIPSCAEMNDLIKRFTQWSIVESTELVTSHDYLSMLASHQFPAITDIRPNHEIGYYTSVKPDVVHEFFGHGPFLTNTSFTHFMQQLAELALGFETHEQAKISRLFWYTIEFGLIQTDNGLRAYGAGIIPSEDEMHNALFNENIERREFNIIDILRTPFSGIRKQEVYYVISDFDELYSVLNTDLSYALSQAIHLGNFSTTHA